MRLYARSVLALVAALLSPTSAFAQQAERATPKTILDGTMTVNGIIELAVTGIGLFVSVITIIGYFERRRIAAEERAEKREAEQREDADRKDREFKAEARERDERMLAEYRAGRDSVEKRLGAVEAKVELHAREYMPRGEILGAIDHEKGNRLTSTTALQRLWEKSDADIRAIMIEMGGLKQQQVGTAAAVDRIESKLDKVQESLNTLSRKV